MRPSHIKLMAILLSGLSFISCSIKEERTGCPCWLKVYLPPLTKAQAYSDITISLEGKSLFSQESLSSSMGGRIAERAVPRGYLSISAVNGSGRGVLEQSCYRIAQGSQCDSVFAHISNVDCTGEQAADTVHLHKQFCTLSIIIRGAPEGQNISVMAEGNSSGFSLMNLSVLSGSFSCEAEKTESAAWRVIIPRQGDNKLSLSIFKSGNSSDEREYVGSCLAGEILASAGFDWEARSLADATITIDYSTWSSIVRIDPWEPGTSQEIIL